MREQEERISSDVVGVPFGDLRGHVLADLLEELADKLRIEDNKAYDNGKHGLHVSRVEVFIGDPHADDFPVNNRLPSFVYNAVCVYADIHQTEYY